MILGDLAGRHYAPMTVLSFGVMTPLGYLLHSHFTFREKLSSRGFLRFASGGAAGFPLSLLSMAILCTGLGLSVLIARPLLRLLSSSGTTLRPIGQSSTAGGLTERRTTEGVTEHGNFVRGRRYRKPLFR
jgi:hypothetical protein